ncbi:MAG TPA: hypothetical protein VF550_02570 [Polyangia bacterium]
MTPCWIAALATCLALQPTTPNLSRQVASLDSQRDPARLEAAAVAIVGSGNARAIQKLAAYLGQRSFLRRLDSGQHGESDIDRLLHVFRALVDHPNATTEALCVALAQNAEFTSMPERLNLLLNALAAVQPMSKEAAAIFRETSRSGYLGVNGPLLARNASPVALKVLEELFLDERLDAQDRIDVAHRGLLSMRTDPAVVAMCARVAVSPLVSSRVRTAIAETLFDYQPKPWFGVAMNQPTPPEWKSANEPARNALRSLGKTLLSQPDVANNLRTAILNTLAQLGAERNDEVQP